jgi:hypothetical protein
VTSDKGSKTVSKQRGGQPVMAQDQANYHLVALMKAQQSAARGQGTATGAAAEPVAKQGIGTATSASSKDPIIRTEG